MLPLYVSISPFLSTMLKNYEKEKNRAEYVAKLNEALLVLKYILCKYSVA